MRVGRLACLDPWAWLCANSYGTPALPCCKLVPPTICAETVKFFNNEKFEEGRFEKAIIAYQRANYQTQTRWVVRFVKKKICVGVCLLVVCECVLARGVCLCREGFLLG